MTVESPSSLDRKDTNQMYQPRQDKFEGYAQLPRPKLAPDRNSSISSAGSGHARGEIYTGQIPELSLEQIIEVRLKRKQEKEHSH